MNVPIIEVVVDSVPISYDTVDGTLQFDLLISPFTTKEILITCSSGDKDFVVSNPGISIDRLKDSVYMVAYLYNLGNAGGPCPIQFFDGIPESGQSIALTTIERIDPDSAEVIQVPLPELSPGLHYIYVKLDPQNIILESNETNNIAFTTIEVPVVEAPIVEAPTYIIINDFEYEDSPLDHGWVINEGEGEVITVYDDSLDSRVMQVTTDQGTGFRIDYPAGHNLTIPKQYLSVKIRDDNYFVFYVRVHASDGRDYYLQYTPDEGVISSGGGYVYVHLGKLYQDGYWHELDRDLDADLFAGARVYLEYVKCFCIRGDCWLDDLILDIVLR